jgi:hypothetical protein
MRSRLPLCLRVSCCLTATISPDTGEKENCHCMFLGVWRASLLRRAPFSQQLWFSVSSVTLW